MAADCLMAPIDASRNSSASSTYASSIQLSRTAAAVRYKAAAYWVYATRLAAALSRPIAARLPRVMKSNMKPGMKDITMSEMSASKVS